MASPFNPGDTVRLKSGGPPMTVEQTDMDGYDREMVWCVWFDEKNKRETSAFVPQTLEKIDM